MQKYIEHFTDNNPEIIYMAVGCAMLHYSYPKENLESNQFIITPLTNQQYPYFLDNIDGKKSSFSFFKKK